jgi:uncharacterized membrane protein
MGSPEAPATATDPGSSVLAACVQEQLARQDARKTSLEQRGITVITTAGALVTLLFGLAAFTTKRSQTFALPGGASYLLVAALVLFFGAALAAILTNVPLSTKKPAPKACARRSTSNGLHRKPKLSETPRSRT